MAKNDLGIFVSLTWTVAVQPTTCSGAVEGPLKNIWSLFEVSRTILHDGPTYRPTCVLPQNSTHPPVTHQL